MFFVENFRKYKENEESKKNPSSQHPEKTTVTVLHTLIHLPLSLSSFPFSLPSFTPLLSSPPLLSLPPLLSPIPKRKDNNIL